VGEGRESEREVRERKKEREREREIEKHTKKNLWIKPERNVAKLF